MLRPRGLATAALAAVVLAALALPRAEPAPHLASGEALAICGLLAAVVLGVAFALWAIATLGRHYDVELEIHSDHELVRDGPYRVVRHPLYAGLGLHFAGACLATGNLALIAGTVLVTYPALVYRAWVEERLLRERFGAAYDEYARRVGMLVPLP
jgi:protein-S-isoprenylcysteine O-methyltransferase Ste14